MRFLIKLTICLLLAGAAGIVYLSTRSGDPLYTLYEWVSPKRFQQHDALIRTVAAEHQLDPMLVKAVVWRESRFDAQKFGTAGERGLMQVSEKAAGNGRNGRRSRIFGSRNCLIERTWKRGPVSPSRHRALQNQANPMPFALAEYNAGASRALRWAG